MPEQWTTVSDDRVIKLITSSLDNNDYLVGGSVRDFLLGKAPVDYDILTFGDVWSKASVIAGLLEAKPFWMDEERGIVRVVSHDGITVDVCAPKGETLDIDLENRDITINAIALNLATKELYDPLKGLRDINRHIIRAVSEKSFSDDALRTLRCLRFSAVLGFTIDEETLQLIKKYAHGLKEVSPERIKQELTAVLSISGGSRIFSLMESAGITEVLFPGYDDVYQGIHHRWPLLRHAILAAESADSLIALSEEILPGSAALLAEEIEDGLDRACLLRFTAFLHDIGKPSTRQDAEDGLVHFYGHAAEGARLGAQLCRGLKFSSSFCSKVSGLIEMHMRILDLACGGMITQKAMHRLLKASESFVPELLLLSLADAVATGKDPGYQGARTEIEDIIKSIWTYYTDVFLKNKKSPLLNGHDIMTSLEINPGPEVGRLLSSIEEARAEGLISNKDDAIDFIKSKS